MSRPDGTLAALRPSFTPVPAAPESPVTQQVIQTLGMLVHPEGGYYVETDRDPLRIANPFRTSDDDDDDATRAASTSIYYLLTPTNPTGHFHRNKGRTIHTLHSGRGVYVIIHADEVHSGHKARVETFVVGHNLAKGERLQWLVEGGKFKASFLLPDSGTADSGGLLISETVVPGFEFADHDFMRPETLQDLTTAEQHSELSWLLNK